MYPSGSSKSSGTTIPRFNGFVPGGGKAATPACLPGSLRVYVGFSCSLGAVDGGVLGFPAVRFSEAAAGGAGGVGVEGRARGSSTTASAGGGSGGVCAI